MPDTLLDSYDRPLPLYSVAQLRARETQAQQHLPAHTLMTRAGRAAAQWLAHRLADRPAARRTVWLAAGPGNNGGDALATAAELSAMGIAAHVCLPVPPSAPDARDALERCRRAGVAVRDALPAAVPADCAWTVDGLFGIGMSRPIGGAHAALVALLNAHHASGGAVLALDLPSGLDADTGAVMEGGTAVEATDTLTFLAAKTGLFTHMGPVLAGHVWVAPIGCGFGGAPDDTDAQYADGTADTTTTPPGARLIAPSSFVAALPRRSAQMNKGSFGSVAVIGGADGMCGAPILAARAALHGGAGKVHVALLGAEKPAYDTLHPELMLHALDALSLERMSALAIGPGLGDSELAHDTVAHVMDTGLPAVLDADALNLLARSRDLATRVVRGPLRFIMTPHPLEAARLLGREVREIQADRLAAARELAARYHAVAVLKGAGTIVAMPAGPSAVNPTGNVALATGGTGDVLTGFIGALLAQGVGLFDAAGAAVFLHGRAAQVLTEGGDGPAGMTAGELAPVFRRLLNQVAARPR